MIRVQVLSRDKGAYHLSGYVYRGDACLKN